MVVTSAAAALALAFGGGCTGSDLKGVGYGRCSRSALTRIDSRAAATIRERSISSAEADTMEMAETLALARCLMSPSEVKRRNMCSENYCSFLLADIGKPEGCRSTLLPFFNTDNNLVLA